MTMQTKQPTDYRDYKSRMFIMIFNDKKKLLELYNAVSGKKYDDPELLTINTLENAIYMSMKNDLSFLIDSRLSLFEHQSTDNPNMPLRFLMYLSDIYSAMTTGKNIYGTKTIPIPAPKFIVFYNGRKTMPDHQTLRLSDAYMVKDEDVSLELKVDVLNINIGHNGAILEACSTLREYAEYVHRVREYAKEQTIETAVDQAINECIRENILREFLEKNRAEARAMSIYEYNEEEHMRMEREDAFEDGRQAGLKEGHEEGLKEGREVGFKEGLAQAETNTEQERRRADAAEAEVRKLKEELEKLKNNV